MTQERQTRKMPVQALVSICLMILFLANYNIAYAQEMEDLAATTSVPIKEGMLLILADKDTIKKRGICGISQKDGFLIRLERAKLEGNRTFKEIKSKEHESDLLALDKALLPFDDCKKNVTLWNAYDEKWYAAERNRKLAERQKAEALWAQQVVDSGPDIWDGVINGTFFAIPRAHIWFGGRSPDGLENIINLRFYAPDLTARMDAEGPYGENADIVGLLQDEKTYTFPCLGFNNRTTCVSHAFQNIFVREALDCTPNRYNRVHFLESYKARWRRSCKYKGNFGEGYIEKPVYDLDVGMMKLNDRTYFEGDPEFPTAYVVCQKPDTKDPLLLRGLHRVCESSIQIDDNTYFEYGFPQALFWEHKKLQVELKKKIQSFINGQPPI